MKFNNYIGLLSEDIRVVGLEDFFKKLILSKNIPPRKISERYGTPYRSLMNYLEGTRSLPLGICKGIIKTLSRDNKEYKKLLDRLFDNIRFVKSTCSHSQTVKLPKLLDETLAYLIGAMHDGCVFSNSKKNQYLIQYVQHSNKQWLDTISKMLYDIFGIKPKQYSGYVQISNKFVYEFFSKIIKIPQYQRDWSSFLEGKPWKLQRFMIIGMFDAEGWCGHPRDLRLKLSQNNREKLNEIKMVLEQHDIHTGNVVVENSNNHALYVCGKNLIKFVNEIGHLSKHPSKTVKLNILRRVSS